MRPSNPQSPIPTPPAVSGGRRLADAGLGGEPLEILKSDGRSRVWLVDSPSGRRVVKQFRHAPIRQRLAILLRLHPAQRELRSNRRLHRAALAVVPIVDAGTEPAGAGSLAWLATPDAGRSMQHCLRDAAGDRQRIEALVDLAAQLAASLVRAGWRLRDLKPSNIIVDERRTARLIDVGDARRWRGPRDLEHMLAVMDRALARDGIDATHRKRFAERTRADLAAPEDAP